MSGIQDKIERNKKRIESLTKELKESSRSKETRIEELDGKIKALENVIQDLKEENKMLVKQLKEVKAENQILKSKIEQHSTKIEELEKKNEEQKARRNKEESVLIILQIGTATQRNMCEYVLGEHFFEDKFYGFKKIEDIYNEYIKKLDPANQEPATKRLDELKEKISWDKSLVKIVKMWFNDVRVDIAHPKLSSGKIQQATEYLKEEKILSKGMEDTINELKEQWETSEELLQTTFQDNCMRSRNVPATGQQQDTNASKAAKGAEGHDEMACCICNAK